jgi:hypothetical protein
MKKKRMKTEDILKKIEGLKYRYEFEDFISSLNLTDEQFQILSENEDTQVRWRMAKRPDLPKDLMYKLAEDKSSTIRCIIAQHPKLPEDLVYKMAEDKVKPVRYTITTRDDLPKDLIIILHCDSFWRKVIIEGSKRLEKPKNLKSEDLENAYDLIRTSKYIGREEFERTFDYIISTFPEVSEAAKFFKSIILKGKGDLK